MAGTATLVACCFGVLYVFQRCLDFWKAIRYVNNQPGYRTLLAQTSVLPNFLKPIPGITEGRHHSLAKKHKDFELFGRDIISSISVFPPTTTLLLADAAAIKEVCTYRSRFPKPVEQYALLTFYGRNIVASEGDEWKKYRKITAPAFSDKNNKMVWDESCKIMESLFKDVWADKDTIVVDHCLEITLPTPWAGRCLLPDGKNEQFLC